MANFFRVEDLLVYQKLCDLHIEVGDMTRTWPSEERYELCSQLRRSSNSSPANLAEKHSDRHVKNKIEGVNRARGEALESVHHLYIALRKGYITNDCFGSLRQRYEEFVRMLNGLERTLERQLDGNDRRFPELQTTAPQSPS
jgi:four helix bundle protein